MSRARLTDLLNTAREKPESAAFEFTSLYLRAMTAWREARSEADNMLHDHADGLAALWAAAQAMYEAAGRGESAAWHDLGAALARLVKKDTDA